MGETTWDWSANTLGPVPAIVLSGLGFVVAVALQLRQRSYRPWAYWFAVLMVSVFGTTCADAVHVVLGRAVPSVDRGVPRGRAGRVRDLVPGRGDALDPQHRHPAS
ncbi:hypothetical protein [Actinomycetospora sp. TBRC 11914]|uniref:hypothetical protein n=1 Tax=Actinomycetospora sp. TBRC 11914 TaxID=2729387 RepID=UPI0020070A4B|nr:hypothetical protein [Actinomycetospora sp. TBRC 11914]